MFPDRAENYVTAIFDDSDELADFPFIGVARDDLRPGLRTLGFRRRGERHERFEHVGA